MEAYGELEQILEVDLAACGLAPLVLAVDLFHQVGRDRRGVIAEGAPVALGRNPLSLGPLDLGREIAGPSRRLNGAGSVFAIWRRSSAFVGRIRPTESGAKW